MSNKSGVDSSVISLPQGGGAVSGMGETFSPDLFTGTGNFSVPIALPAGRNGFQPSLTLQYSTGNGSSHFGFGWGLSVPGVMRKTSKGIPRYDDTQDTFILSGAEDLVPIPGGDDGVQRYRPRTEGLFARIEHHKPGNGDDFWKVWSKDGLISFYGASSTEEYTDENSLIRNPESLDNIFAWKLTKTVDPLGNIIVYEYEKPPAEERDTKEHLFDESRLKTVKYVDFEDGSEQTRFLVSAQLIYEDRPDPYSDHNVGFELRTTKRCSQIEVYTHPELVEGTGIYTDVLSKRYELTYVDERVENGELAASALPPNGASLLSTVQVVGVDGVVDPENPEVQKMPPLEFTYSHFEVEGRDLQAIENTNLPGASLSDPSIELADLFGNGMPDIIQLNGVARYWRNRGDGTFDQPRNFEAVPAGLGLEDPDVQLMDADGNGRIDLTVNKQNIKGYFPLNFDARFDERSFKRYDTAPTFSFADPEVRLMDLDGDGVTDVLRNGSRLEYYYHDQEKGWGETQFIQKKTLGSFPNVSFADPRVRTASMTGGLQDIVMLYDGNVQYWPNQGRGKWGRKVVMRNAPRLPFNYSPQRIFLADVDGDGFTDMLYIDQNKVMVWINQAGNAWSDPYVIEGTPDVTDRDSVRVVDLFGNGVAGILWSRDFSSSRRQKMFYLTFNKGIKPYVLNEMNNNMGAITRVSYKPSTHFYREDYNDPKTRWETPLPFPVQCVASVEVNDVFSKGKLTTAYEYHHGYWDGVEREFRGFGYVVQRDTESFQGYNNPDDDSFEDVEAQHFSPPTETRTWFHLGPVADGSGDWKELDLSHLYWQGDSNKLSRPYQMKRFLSYLQAGDRRDALRTLRGSILRSELYERDGSLRQGRPHTVSENQTGVGEVVTFDNSGAIDHEISFDGSTTLTGERVETTKRIFFPHSLSGRNTRWERGTEPLTQLSFTADYDKYGQPSKQLSIAVPFERKDDWWKTGSSTNPFLSVYSETSFVTEAEDNSINTDGRYMINRSLEQTSYEVQVSDNTVSVFELAENVLLGTTQFHSLERLSHSKTYYTDNTVSAFEALPDGKIGNYGIPAFTETLITDTQIFEDAYGTGNIPTYIKDQIPTWAGTDYDDAVLFKAYIEARTSQAGYIQKDISGTSPQEHEYYARSGFVAYDFHYGTGKGLVLKMADPLQKTDNGEYTTITYDKYSHLPTETRDPRGMRTAADYDYRLLQPRCSQEPNGNTSHYTYTPLGLLKDVQVNAATLKPVTIEAIHTWLSAWVDDGNSLNDTAALLIAFNSTYQTDFEAQDLALLLSKTGIWHSSVEVQPSVKFPDEQELKPSDGSFTHSIWVKASDLTGSTAQTLISTQRNVGTKRWTGLAVYAFEGKVRLVGGLDAMFPPPSSNDEALFSLVQTTNVVLTDDEWNHVIIRRNPSNSTDPIEVIVNGNKAELEHPALFTSYSTLLDDHDFDLGDPSTQAPLELGRREFASSPLPLNGLLKNYLFYNRALLDVEVETLNNQCGSLPEGFSLFAPCNGESGSTTKVLDYSSNSYHSTSVHTTAFSRDLALVSELKCPDGLIYFPQRCTQPSQAPYAGLYDLFNDWLDSGGDINDITAFVAIFNAEYSQNASLLELELLLSEYKVWQAETALPPTITFPNDPLLKPTDGPFTVSLKFKTPNATSSEQVLFSTQNQVNPQQWVGLAVYTVNGKIRIIGGMNDEPGATLPSYSSYQTQATPLVNDKWHQLVIRRDPNNTANPIEVFIDGTFYPLEYHEALDYLLTRPAFTLGTANQQSPFQLGQRTFGTGNPFTGQMRNCLLYNNALTDTQLHTLTTCSPPPPGYDLYAPLNEAPTPTTTVRDHSPNQLDGTIQGTPSRTRTLSPYAICPEVRNLPHGDTPQKPSLQYQYDLLAYTQRSEPLSVRTTRREHHAINQYNDISFTPNDPDAVIESVEYSDGFGRLLQTRAQAEDQILSSSPTPLFGDSGLPTNPTDPNQNATLRTLTDAVIVSGLTIYNNKGEPVKQYEPYFDSGFEYKTGSQQGQFVTLFYDGLGRTIRTLAPDGTEARTIYGKAKPHATIANKFLPILENPSPWISYAFDANDLAPLTHPTDTSVPTDHHYTPASAEIDPLGRTIKTTTRNYKNAAVEEIIVVNTYDIRGNLLSIKDPLERTSVTTIYDYANQALKTTSIDTVDDIDPQLPGSAKVVYNAAGQVLETWDTSGAKSLSVVDELGRPIAAYARDNSGQNLTLRSKIIYGDDPGNGLANPILTNHLGRAYKAYDEAGVTTSVEFDFKGNLLNSIQEVIADSELLNATDYFTVDWSTGNEPALSSTQYEVGTYFDGLNRSIRTILPEDQDSERKIVTANYNRAGGIKSIDLDGETYVSEIKYSAKGEQLLVAFGVGLMTRYVYDSQTNLLQRFVTEKYTFANDTFTPSGTHQQDLSYYYDLGGNIIQQKDNLEGSGSGSGAHTNKLNRDFTYDAIYRLLSATGRESDTYVSPAPSVISNTPYTPGSTNSKDTRMYTQSYQYDKLGNIQQLSHVPTGGNSWNRIFTYENGRDRLTRIAIGQTDYNFSYNTLGSLNQRGDNYYYWDGADQLRAYKVDDGTTISKHSHYLYSGGERVKKLYKKQNGDYDVTIYIGIFEHRYQVRPSGTDKAQNVIHVAGMAQRRIGDAFTNEFTEDITYQLKDHLSSNSLTVTKNGTVLSKEEFYPFGETSFGSYSKKRYRFTGKEQDDCSGLYYYGARYYAPWTCKFLSVDPIYNPAESPYVYSGNDPINFNDPSGMQREGPVSDGTNGGDGGGGGGKSVFGVAEDGIATSEIEATTITGEPGAQSHARDFMNNGVNGALTKRGGFTFGMYGRPMQDDGLSFGPMSDWLIDKVILPSIQGASDGLSDSINGVIDLVTGKYSNNQLKKLAWDTAQSTLLDAYTLGGHSSAKWLSETAVSTYEGYQDGGIEGASYSAGYNVGPKAAEAAAAWAGAGAVGRVGGASSRLSRALAPMRRAAYYRAKLNVMKLRGKSPDTRVPRSIDAGQQGKHIPGHNNFHFGFKDGKLQFKSILSVNPQKLLDDFHTSNIKSFRRINETKVIVQYNSFVGFAKSKRTGDWIPTNRAMIVEKPNGAHIYPQPSPKE